MALTIDPAATSPLTTRQSTSAPDATDFRQFAALRRGAEANDPKTLREVARQFESIFTKMMLKSMRDASFGDQLLGSDQVEMYQGMMDDQLAVSLSQGKGLGLADMLVRQLQTQAGVAPGAGNVTPEQQKKFVEGMLPHATAAARELGVDPKAIIAQAALETGWGTSQPADASGKSNNVFGIKAQGGWQGASVTSDTTEFTDGAAGRESAQFRAYGSVAENVADYVRVLRQPRYADALGTGTDVRAFANALQRGGYATDPAYADKLVAIYGKLGGAVDARQVVAADAPANVKAFKSGDVEPIDTSRMNNG
jgi:flagellar protein FlgJ